MVYTRKVKRKRFNTKKKGLKKIGIKQRNTKKNLGKRKQKGGGGTITIEHMESAVKVFNELFGGLEKIIEEKKMEEEGKDLSTMEYVLNNLKTKKKVEYYDVLKGINDVVNKKTLNGSVNLKEGQKCNTNLMTGLKTYMEKSEDTPHKNILQNSQKEKMECEDAKGFYYGTLFLNNLLIIHLYLLNGNYSIEYSDIHEKINSRFDDLTSIIKKITREGEWMIVKDSNREKIALKIINNGIMKIGNLSAAVQKVFTDMSYPEELSSAGKPNLDSKAIKTMISTLEDIVNEKINNVTGDKGDSFGTVSTSSLTGTDYSSYTGPSPPINKETKEIVARLRKRGVERDERNAFDEMNIRGEKVEKVGEKSHELSEGASNFNNMTKQLNRELHSKDNNWGIF